MKRVEFIDLYYNISWSNEDLIGKGEFGAVRICYKIYGGRARSTRTNPLAIKILEKAKINENI